MSVMKPSSNYKKNSMPMKEFIGILKVQLKRSKNELRDWKVYSNKEEFQCLIMKMMTKIIPHPIVISKLGPITRNQGSILLMNITTLIMVGIQITMMMNCPCNYWLQMRKLMSLILYLSIKTLNWMTWVNKFSNPLDPNCSKKELSR